MSADRSGGGPAGPPPAPAVVIYTRPGCHLCENAMAVLIAAHARVSFDLREIDIESDDELFKRYLERIPVVAIDGEEVFDFVVDQAEFEARVAKSGGEIVPQVE